MMVTNDFLGNNIEVGDEVVYLTYKNYYKPITTKWVTFARGNVTKVTERNVYIVGERRNPNRVINISALKRSSSKERNDPLTLDDLQKMNGEPVWIQLIDSRKSGHWAIVAGVDTKYGEKTLYLEGNFTCRDYGKTWLAYRHKPEEGKV